ncbi:MAG: recombinase family protein [Planctomycetes bacterium]|nr:recombinase family protein [Planctomycetota bacterium]
MERNLTRERTRSAMAIKKANGQRVGTVPYGFDLADDGKTLTENPAETEVIGQIQAMRSEGATLQRIAQSLTDRGIPTKTGRSDSWQHKTIGRILARPNAAAGYP